MSHAFLTKRADGLPRPAVASVFTVLLALGVLALAPPARAGGDFVDLAVGSRVSGSSASLACANSTPVPDDTLASPQLVGAPYPLSVTLAGGAAWVASVENGYVWGTLTRIDVQTGRRHVLWRKPDSSVQYVAAGTGGVWALIGSSGTPGSRASPSPAGSLAAGLFPDAGRMAADAAAAGSPPTTGCCTSTEADAAPHPSSAARRCQHRRRRSLATTSRQRALRIDEHTGRIRTPSTPAALQLGGFQHDLAAGDGALWALTGNRSHTRLERFDPRGPQHRQLEIPRDRRRAQARRDLDRHRDRAPEPAGQRLRHHPHQPTHASSQPASADQLTSHR